MKVVINPHRRRRLQESAIRNDIKEAVGFHRSLPGYSETPLIDLTMAAEEFRFGSLLVKDEGRRFGLKAFKSLGASYAVFRLLKKMAGGSLLPEEFLTKGAGIASDLTFTTATDGNHGRAVAWVARLLGRPAFIYMPKDSAEARVRAIESEGAEVIIVDGSYDDTVRRTSEDAGRFGRTLISDTAYAGYTEIPLYIQQGYLTMFAEIRSRIKEMKFPAPNLVFIQSGVGAFAAAAAKFFSSVYEDAKLVSVEPVCTDCLLRSAENSSGMPVTVHPEGETIMAGLNCGTPSLTAWEVIKDSFYAFTAIEDKWAEEAMRRLAVYGIISGESGAAGFAALLALKKERPEFFTQLKQASSPNVLIINTEADTDPVSYDRIVNCDR